VVVVVVEVSCKCWKWPEVVAAAGSLHLVAVAGKVAQPVVVVVVVARISMVEEPCSLNNNPKYKKVKRTIKPPINGHVKKRTL